MRGTGYILNECAQQIALFPAGCEALKANEAVIQALSTLKDKAWSEEAKICAEGALMALIPPEHHGEAVNAPHIMMSCECTSVSAVIALVSRWDCHDCAACQTNGMSRRSSRRSWLSCSAASISYGLTVSVSLAFTTASIVRSANCSCCLIQWSA